MDADTKTLLVLIRKVAKQLLAAAQRLTDKPENAVPPEWAVEQAKEQKCLACDGKKQPPNRRLKRGQCANCYPKTMRRIRDGKWKESQLITAGKLLPAGVGGRSDSDFELIETPHDVVTKALASTPPPPVTRKPKTAKKP